MFSGTISRNDTIYVITPKKREKRKGSNANFENISGNNFDIRNDIVEVKVTRLYLCMGQYLESIDSVTSGSICVIGDLGHLGFKNATISNIKECNII